MTAPPPAVTFDFAAWQAMFPELAGVSSVQATAWFSRAGLWCANDTCNPAFNAGILPQLLYLLTAHLAQLYAPRDANGNPAPTGTPPPGLVGRISSAGEGSVNVGVEWNGSGSPSEAFFLQTQYGAEYWQATAQFRTFRYGARPTVVVDSIFPWRRGLRW